MADNVINAILVDDEESALNHLQDLLSEHPEVNIIAKFKDPETAIEGIFELKPQLLFLDIQMPKLTGFDIVKEIRV